MLTNDDNQKATKAHCRLAFSAQPQRFFLPLLVGLHGSTDTTARKSAIEEKMFWKVTLPFALIFCAKDVCTINFTVSFYLYLYLQPREKCFFFRRWVTWSWHNIQRWKRILYFVSLAAWRRRASSNPGNWVCPFFLFFPLPTVLAFFHDQTRTLTQARKVRRHPERPKGDRDQFASLDFWITDLCLTRGVHLVSNMIWSIHRIN